MPFEVGNQHSAKAKLFYGAMMRACAQDDGARLRKTAETVLTKAANGEVWAVYLLRDTLDGKPSQQIDAKVEATHLVVDEIEQARLVSMALRLGLARLAEREATTIEPVDVRLEAPST